MSIAIFVVSILVIAGIGINILARVHGARWTD